MKDLKVGFLLDGRCWCQPTLLVSDSWLCRYRTQSETTDIANGLFALDTACGDEKVLLCFCNSEAHVHQVTELDSNLSSKYVCKLDVTLLRFLSHSTRVRLVNIIESKNSLPSCLVFEAGDVGLDEFMQSAELDLFTKKSMLRKVGSTVFRTVYK